MKLRFEPLNSGEENVDLVELKIHTKSYRKSSLESSCCYQQSRTFNFQCILRKYKQGILQDIYDLFDKSLK
jgi:hypothetical protein